MTKMGRPTKYVEYETVNKVYEYINNCKDSGKLPALCGLSLFLCIAKDTINEWVKEDDKKDFSIAVKWVTTSQEEMLLEKGLSNDFNSTITKLMLHNHGYADKKEIETTEKPYEGVSDKELAHRRRLLQDEIGGDQENGPVGGDD